MLKINELTKSYGETLIIQNISLECEKGSFHAIIGPSGAGKTTLLKLIAGIEVPDTGWIMLEGKKLDSPEDQLVRGYEEIKIVHQDFQLKANMTVFENLNYAMIGYDPKYKKQRIGELLELCRLEQSINKPSNELSGGQKQRLAIARALATEPAIILMDEPFSNLDPMTKNSLLLESKTIARQTDTTIILVTHDTRDAMEVADCVHVLMDGTIAQEGTPIDIYTCPLSPRVAHLLGYINVLKNNSELEGFWAEDIKINKKTFRGTVVQTIFKGAYQLVKIQSPVFDHALLAFDNTKTLSINDKITFGFNEANKISFGPAKPWDQWLLDQ
jgi:ABC-type Fe3+/spermidine/putrescine transport system ATPase subunit